MRYAVAALLLALPLPALAQHVPAPGPYKVAIETDPTLPRHTIYRPADLAALHGKRLPVVAWANGACSNAGLLFATFLSQLASHGYLVIASGPKDAALPAFSTQKRDAAITPSGAIPEGKTSEADLLAAIDWAEHKGGAIDASKVAVMGQSCGGLQATAVAADPRIDTLVIWNSGVYNNPAATGPGGIPQQSMSSATKASLAKFHAPVAYFLGGPSDRAYPNGKDDFGRVTGVPAFFGSIDVGHGGTFTQPGGGWFGEVAAQWLDWRLKGDAAAAKWFAGKDCRLCSEPGWEVAKKGID